LLEVAHEHNSYCSGKETSDTVWYEDDPTNLYRELMIQKVSVKKRKNLKHPELQQDVHVDNVDIVYHYSVSQSI